MSCLPVQGLFRQIGRFQHKEERRRASRRQSLGFAPKLVALAFLALVEREIRERSAANLDFLRDPWLQRLGLANLKDVQMPRGVQPGGCRHKAEARHGLLAGQLSFFKANHGSSSEMGLIISATKYTILGRESLMAPDSFA